MNFPHQLQQPRSEFGGVLVFGGGDENGAVVFFGDPGVFEFFQAYVFACLRCEVVGLLLDVGGGLDFIEDHQRGFVGGFYFN